MALLVIQHAHAQTSEIPISLAERINIGLFAEDCYYARAVKGANKMNLYSLSLNSRGILKDRASISRLGAINIDTIRKFSDRTMVLDVTVPHYDFLIRKEHKTRILFDDGYLYHHYGRLIEDCLPTITEIYRQSSDYKTLIADRLNLKTGADFRLVKSERDSILKFLYYSGQSVDTTYVDTTTWVRSGNFNRRIKNQYSEIERVEFSDSLLKSLLYENLISYRIYNDSLCNSLPREERYHSLYNKRASFFDFDYFADNAVTILPNYFNVRLNAKAVPIISPYRAKRNSINKSGYRGGNNYTFFYLAIPRRFYKGEAGSGRYLYDDSLSFCETKEVSKDSDAGDSFTQKLSLHEYLAKDFKQFIIAVDTIGNRLRFIYGEGLYLSIDPEPYIPEKEYKRIPSEWTRKYLSEFVYDVFFDLRLGRMESEDYTFDSPYTFTVVTTGEIEGERKKLKIEGRLFEPYKLSYTVVE